MKLSLKWKIQLWHLLILTGVVTLLMVLIYQFEKSVLIHELDTSLDQQIHPLIAQGSMASGRRGPPGGHGSRPPRHHPENPREKLPEVLQGGWENYNKGLPRNPQGEPSRRLFAEFQQRFEPLGYYAVVWSPEGELLYRSSTAPETGKPAIRHPGYWIRSVGGVRREIFHQRPEAVVLVGRFLGNHWQELNTLRWRLVGLGIVIVAFGTAIGAVGVNQSLRGLDDIYHTSAAVAEGMLQTRIPERAMRGSTELAALGTNLNETFSRLEKLFQRQVQFTADASHELRTPLTALIAHLQLSQDKSRSEKEYQEILEVCQRSAKRIHRITVDLMELSRLDSGRADLEKQVWRLDLLINGLAEDLRPLVEQGGSSLQLQLVPAEADCDAFRIEQVVTNLINNALEHNSQPVNILVKTRESGSKAFIEVIDDGKGIAEESLSRLFDRFFQEKHSQSGVNGGPRTNVGLGLAISQAIVAAHGGDIKATSIPHQATTFTVTLPRARKC